MFVCLQWVVCGHWMFAKLVGPPQLLGSSLRTCASVETWIQRRCSGPHPTGLAQIPHLPQTRKGQQLRSHRDLFAFTSNIWGTSGEPNPGQGDTFLSRENTICQSCCIPQYLPILSSLPAAWTLWTTGFTHTKHPLMPSWAPYPRFCLSWHNSAEYKPRQCPQETIMNSRLGPSQQTFRPLGCSNPNPFILQRALSLSSFYPFTKHICFTSSHHVHRPSWPSTAL